MSDADASSGATPRRSIPALTRAIGPDTPVLIRAGVVGMAVAVVFGAGVWATSMTTSISQLTFNAAKTDAKLEKIEAIMMEVLRAQAVSNAKESKGNNP